MNAERWEKVAELYGLASARAPEQRQAFLTQACGEDEELLRELLSLLAQPVANDGILERVASDIQNLHVLPASIGGYRILRLIAEGGMGAVYEAEQDHPRRIVALKVMKFGLGSPELLRRFQREAQALGRLQHPGIARIYEAGVEQTSFGGQPYFAMEYIEGLSLLAYASAHHFDTRKKLEMTILICAAVQHAHERGIIHRDLKPANILVDAEGQPKVLDFGVARMMSRDGLATRQTEFGQMVGTLAYMSPEQMLGQADEIDATTDVYALGVVLYELLAGRLPYALSAEILEAIRTIREEEPAPLGSVAREYRGDLETIVRKAMEKEKARRYPSPALLAEDLRRYLSEEPVMAQPPSRSYRARKFVRRHKGLTAAVIAVAAVLAAGTVASTWQAIRARRAERAALVERDRATAAERAATRERNLADQARLRALEASRRADLNAAVANAVNSFLQNDLLGLAGAEGQSLANTKPDPNLAVRAVLDRAAAGIGRRFESQPLVEAGVRHAIGSAYRELGLYPDAELHLRRAFELRRRERGLEDPDTLNSMHELGIVLYRTGQNADAAKLMTEYVGEQRRLRGPNSREALVGMGDLANVFLLDGKYELAEAMLTEALAGQKRVAGKANPDTLVTMNNLASAYVDRGKYGAAERLYQEVIAGKRQLLGPEHPSTLLSMNSLAVAYRNAGKYGQAEKLLSAALDARRRAMGATHPDTAISMNSMGLLYVAQGRYADAEPILNQALELVRGALGDNAPDTLRVLNSLAELDRRRGNREAAETKFRQVLEGRKRVLGLAHPATAAVLVSLGEIQLEQGQWKEAEALLGQAVQGLQKSNPDGWRRYWAQCMLGASLAALGRKAEATPLLVSGYAELEKRTETIPFENRGVLAQARGWLPGSQR